MKPYETVQVEGTDDQEILDLMLPFKGVYKAAGNKAKVQRTVQKNEALCGIVDRDFDSDELVEQSRQKGKRLAILRRYSLENYLLEPAYLYTFAKRIGADQHPNWASTEAIEQLIVRCGQALSHYAAANEMLLQIAKDMNFQHLTPYLKPILDADEVRLILSDRFQKLPTRETKDSFLAEWEKRAEEIAICCVTLEGVNRWINGKVLLRDVMYEKLTEAHPPFSKTSKKDFVQHLTNIAKDKPPADLLDILKFFGITPIGIIHI